METTSLVSEGNNTCAGHYRQINAKWIVWYESKAKDSILHYRPFNAKWIFPFELLTTYGNKRTGYYITGLLTLSEGDRSIDAKWIV